MPQESSSSQQLTFCHDCGCLRLRDVTSQLQELFTKRTIIGDVCGICNQSTTADNIQTSATSISLRDSAVRHVPQDNTVGEVEDGESQIIVTSKPGSWLHTYAAEPAACPTRKDNCRNISLEGQSRGPVGSNNKVVENHLGDECLSENVGDSSSSSVVAESMQIPKRLLAPKSESSTSAAAADKDIADANQDLQQTGRATPRATRLRTGALRAKNYQFMSVESKSDGADEEGVGEEGEEIEIEVDDAEDEDFVPDDGEDTATIEYEVSDTQVDVSTAPQVKTDEFGGATADTEKVEEARKTAMDTCDAQGEGSDRGTKKKNINRHSYKKSDIDFSQYKVAEKTTAAMDDGDAQGEGSDSSTKKKNINRRSYKNSDIDLSQYKVTEKTSRPGNWNNNIIEVLDPVLQKLVMEGPDPKNPFQCTLCSCAFKFIGRFHRHLVYFHCDDIQVAMIEKPFCCLECYAKFQNTRELSSHSLNHRKKHKRLTTMYKCCDFTYNRADDLIRHVEVHKGIRKYQCEKCGLGFNKNSEYLRHARKIHGMINCEMSVPPGPRVRGSRARIVRPSKKQTTKKSTKLDEVTIFGKKSTKVDRVTIFGKKSKKVDEVEILSTRSGSKSKKQAASHKGPKEGSKYQGRNVKYKLKCDHCPLAFKRLDEMKKHQMRKHWKTEFVCARCKSSYRVKKALKMHIRANRCGQWFKKPKDYLNDAVLDMMGELEHDDMPFRCKHCDELVEFNSKQVVEFLDHHKENHRDVYPEIENIMNDAFKCGECNHTLPSPALLVSHLTDHNDGGGSSSALKCSHPQCDETFDSKPSLIKHSMKHSPQCSYICYFCQKHVDTMELITKHLKEAHGITRGSYSCPFCEEVFSEKSRHVKHLKTQHGVLRPYRCKLCSKSYCDKPALNEHVDTNHTGKKDHLCTLCGLRFVRNRQLQHHIRSAHHDVVTPDPRPACSECGARFTLLKSLRVHVQRVHLKLKPHVCETCGKAFASNSDLKKHKSNHSDAKPHGCDQCSFTCKRLDSLRKHERRHGVRNVRAQSTANLRIITSPQSMHKCDLCDLILADDNSLRDHNDQHHPSTETFPVQIYTCS